MSVIPGIEQNILIASSRRSKGEKVQRQWKLGMEGQCVGIEGPPAHAPDLKYDY